MPSFCLKQSAYLERAEIGLRCSNALGICLLPVFKYHLDTFLSLLRRFPSVDGAQKPPINEIQPNLNPLDILYDIRKLMNEANVRRHSAVLFLLTHTQTSTKEQPLSASFIKIVEALGVFDHWCDGKTSTVKESDQWAQHVVQANIWNAAGMPQKKVSIRFLTR